MAAAPTNTPVVPNPTLTVESPIESSSSFATKRSEWFVKGIEDPPPTVATPIVSPVFV